MIQASSRGSLYYMIKGLSLLFLGLGVFVLMQVLMPFVSFKVWEFTTFGTEAGLIDPAPVSANGDLAPDFHIETVNNFPAIIGKKSDKPLAYDEFKLSIPTIKLDQVPVKVESFKFDEFYTKWGASFRRYLMCVGAAHIRCHRTGTDGRRPRKS